ncbi:asparagine--tRNA ligase, putative [Hepatocystis sp. ex Piliocolobus tephrosceles]|nr:asparagine--tRNA ligase, putative [Hepatocystis sp. ex Piliocolobus tephrosceles]
MDVVVSEKTIETAMKYVNECKDEFESNILKPKTERLRNPRSDLLEVIEKGCRGRIKIFNLLNIPKSEKEYNKIISSETVIDNPYVNQIVTVCGWSKTIRKQGGGRFCFVNLNDGSCHINLQIIVDSTVTNYEKLLKCGVGCCFRFTGTLILSPVQNKEKKGLIQQNVELTLQDNNIHNFEIYGENLNPQSYPLSKKSHNKEFLREVAHLRPRSYFISSVIRVRNALAIATHLFFQSRGFLYIHTPLITTSDCEGGGEMFTVTTLLDESGDIKSIPKIKKSKNISTTVVSSDGVKTSEKREPINNSEQLTDSNKINGTHKDNTSNLNNLDSNDTSGKTGGITNGNIDKSTCTGTDTSGDYLVNYKKDFFNKQAFLTVSGQLSLENICSAMGDVYTFGPTFRAELSHTSRHLAEFWMIEPEIAFSDLYDTMELAESYIKYCIEYVLNNNFFDLYYFETNVEEGLIERLKNVLNKDFVRITYTNVINLLLEFSSTFETPVSWGMDLQSEHERFVAEKIFKKPVIVYNYPKDLKAFYMKLNKDNKTVAAMDVLVPKIGEVIGGSQREDNLELLDNMIKEKKLNMDSYWWYRQLRQYGSHPHSGFGLGFERLIMLVTGVDNIKDTIPFPRYHGHAEF